MTLKRTMMTSALAVALLTAGTSAGAASTIAPADLPSVAPAAREATPAAPTTPVLRDLADPLDLKIGVAVDADAEGAQGCGVGAPDQLVVEHLLGAR